MSLSYPSFHSFGSYCVPLRIRVLPLLSNPARLSLSIYASNPLRCCPLSSLRRHSSDLARPHIHFKHHILHPTSFPASPSILYAPTSLAFFSRSDKFQGADPTNGYVTYVDQNTAQSSGLINTNNGQVYLGVDYQNVASGSGRRSVRVSSNAAYNHGLFILDLAHMPGSICGAWPAL